MVSSCPLHFGTRVSIFRSGRIATALRGGATPLPSAAQSPRGWGLAEPVPGANVLKPPQGTRPLTPQGVSSEVAINTFLMTGMVLTFWK